MLVNIKNLGFNIDTIHILYFSSIDYNSKENVYNMISAFSINVEYDYCV